MIDQQAELQSIEWKPRLNHIEVRLDGVLVCQCPVNGKQDRAHVEVTYSPNCALIELGSFRHYLESFAGQQVYHEAVTADMWEALETLIDAHYLTVRTTWDAVEGIPCVVTCSS